MFTNGRENVVSIGVIQVLVIFKSLINKYWLADWTKFLPSTISLYLFEFNPVKVIADAGDISKCHLLKSPVDVISIGAPPTVADT